MQPVAVGRLSPGSLSTRLDAGGGDRGVLRVGGERAGNICPGVRLQAGMAMEDMQRGGQGAVEFDDSAEAGSVENRTSIVRSLVEDLNSSGERQFSQQITVDSKTWRVVVEQLPG